MKGRLSVYFVFKVLDSGFFILRCANTNSTRFFGIRTLNYFYFIAKIVIDRSLKTAKNVLNHMFFWPVKATNRFLLSMHFAFLNLSKLDFIVLMVELVVSQNRIPSAWKLKWFKLITFFPACLQSTFELRWPLKAPFSFSTSGQ